MTSRARSLSQLCRLLRGLPVADPNWEAILALANRALVTPRLAGRLPPDAPAEVRVFVEEVARRNHERNTRLLVQLSDAVAALNAAGITPTALKGGAILARRGASSEPMLADLDLLVAPDEVDRTLDALQGAGFKVLGEDFRAHRHEVVGLGRPTDVGQIDLHQRPPGPAGFVAAAFEGGVQIVTLDGGRLGLPTLEQHIYLQALHDQLQDRAYWRGGFDLRHAFDLAALIAPGEVDWARLARAPPTGLIRRALEAHLAAGVLLAGAATPSWTYGLGARLTARRQWVQYAWPALRWPLMALVLGVEAPAYRRHRRADGENRTRDALPPVSRDWRRFVRDLGTEILGRL